MNSTILFLSLISFLCVVFVLYVIVWGASQIIGFIFGAPYVPTRRKTVLVMITLANIMPNDVAMDLGSGDGRLTIAAAEAGARRALGFEIQPLLTWYARAAAKWKGLGGRTVFINKSFWRADLSHITVVFIYQLPSVMKKLEEKLLRELPSGARVVSNEFIFNNWQPEKIEGNIRLYRKQ